VRGIGSTSARPEFLKPMSIKALIDEIEAVPGVEIFGRVAGVRGLMVEIAGPIHAMTVGGRITIEIAGDRLIPCEIVGFEGEKALALPFMGDTTDPAFRRRVLDEVQAKAGGVYQFGPMLAQ